MYHTVKFLLYFLFQTTFTAAGVKSHTFPFSAVVKDIDREIDEVLSRAKSVARGKMKISTSKFWLVGFVALRPKSTAMVIAGRSVHLTTPFPGQA